MRGRRKNKSCSGSSLVRAAGKWVAAALVEPLEARRLLSFSYNGGLLLSNVKVVPIYSTALDSGTTSTLDNFFVTLTGDQYIPTVLGDYSSNGYKIAQGVTAASHSLSFNSYYDPTGTYGPNSFIDREGYGGPQALIEAKIKSGELPFPDANTLYALYPSDGVTVYGPGGENSRGGMAGYHSWGVYKTNPDDTNEIGTGYAYMVIPYPGPTDQTGNAHLTYPGNSVYMADMDQLQAVSSHEMAEAITDPHPPFGWYGAPDATLPNLPSGTEAEIGDLYTDDLYGLDFQYVEAQPSAYDDSVHVKANSLVTYYDTLATHNWTVSRDGDNVKIVTGGVTQRELSLDGLGGIRINLGTAPSGTSITIDQSSGNLPFPIFIDRAGSTQDVNLNVGYSNTFSDQRITVVNPQNTGKWESIRFNTAGQPNGLNVVVQNPTSVHVVGGDGNTTITADGPLMGATRFSAGGGNTTYSAVPGSSLSTVEGSAFNSTSQTLDFSSFSKTPVQIDPSSFGIMEGYTPNGPLTDRFSQIGTFVNGAADIFVRADADNVNYGADHTHVSGAIYAPHTAYGWQGSVNLTLNGVTVNAPIDADGFFSADMPIAGVPAAAAFYGIAISYVPGNADPFINAGLLYNHGTLGAANFLIRATPLTINVTDPSPVYNGQVQAATASTTPAGVPVTFTYRDQFGNTVTPKNAGTYTVFATSGSPGYVGTAQGILTIRPATATIFAANLKSNYTGKAVNGSFSATPSNLPVTIVYKDAAGNLVYAPVNAGSYTYTVTSADPNYIGSATGTITVAPISSNPSLQIPTTVRYDGQPHPATATDTSPGHNLPVSITYFRSDGTPIPVPIDSGIYKVVATLNDPLGNFVGMTQGSLTIASRALTATFSGLQYTYDGLTHSATATLHDTDPNFPVSTVGVTVHYQPTGSVGSASTTTPPSAFGAYRVFATANSPNYSVAGTAFLVIGAAITPNTTSPTFNGQPQQVTATTNPPGLSVQFAYTNASGNPVAAPTQAGSYSYTASVVVPYVLYTTTGTIQISQTFSAGSATGTFVIQKAQPVLALGSASSTFDGLPHTPTAQVAGVVTGVDSTPGALLESVPLILDYVNSDTGADLHTTVPPAAGHYKLTALFAGSTDYAAASGSTTFAIAKASSTTTVTDAGGVYTGNPYPVTAAQATGTGGLNDTALADFVFSYAGSSSTVYGPSPVAPFKPGSYTVSATYLGDANHTASSSAAVAFSIIKAAPTLSTAAGPTIVLGTGAKLTAVATLAGGIGETGQITFTLLSPGGTVVETESVAVNGNGTYATPAGSLATVAGVYQWTASYSGDVSNFSATSNGAAPQNAVGAGATIVGGALYLVGGTTNDQTTIQHIGTSGTGSTGIKLSANLNGKTISATNYAQPPAAIYIVSFNGNDNISMESTLLIPVVVTVGDGNEVIQLGQGSNTVVTGNGNEVIKVGNGNNSITTGNGNNVINAGDGNNSITTGTGNDVISAGNGNNIIVAGAGNNTVQAGNGNNIVVTSTGNNTVQAGNGNNLLVGGLGKHTLQAGSGRNILIDGSVELVAAGDTLSQVLASWIQSGATTAGVANIRSRLKVTYNITNANQLTAGSGFDWFWLSSSKDQANRKPTDLLN